MIYACLRGEHRPQVLYDGAVGTFKSANSFALSGSRLGFLARQEGGVAEDSSFVWVDIRTRVVKLGQFNVASPENSPSDPVAPDAEVHFAIAPDGTVAVIGSDGLAQEVLLMRALSRSLGKPRELGSSSTGDIKLDSIAITPTTVNWTTTAGREAHNAALTCPESASARLAATGTKDVMEHTSITPQEAADRLAIRELIDAYAHCADRREAEGQKALFTEDTHFLVYMNGVGTEPTEDLHGREQLIPVFAALKQYEVTMHFNGQSTVT
ncbi:MAG TPA: nuclear transport factor 2 family protein, partial [Solirubrobacteraceae bacterium]|nr:nuclear transport factor 2 family protein [Solirubrobacteraceae bacterium]